MSNHQQIFTPFPSEVLMLFMDGPLVTSSVTTVGFGIGMGRCDAAAADVAYEWRDICLNIYVDYFKGREVWVRLQIALCIFHCVSTTHPPIIYFFCIYSTI